MQALPKIAVDELKGRMMEHAKLPTETMQTVDVQSPGTIILQMLKYSRVSSVPDWVTLQDIWHGWSPFCATHSLDIHSNSPCMTAHICLWNYFHKHVKPTGSVQAFFVFCIGGHNKHASIRWQFKEV